MKSGDSKTAAMLSGRHGSARIAMNSVSEEVINTV